MYFLECHAVKCSVINDNINTNIRFCSYNSLFFRQMVIEYLVTVSNCYSTDHTKMFDLAHYEPLCAPKLSFAFCSVKTYPIFTERKTFFD